MWTYGYVCRLIKLDTASDENCPIFDNKTELMNLNKSHNKT